MLWDPIRCCQVFATPEEKIRQLWLRRMMGPLGYPKGLLAVEKDLVAVSLQSLGLDPNRRIDILCYTPDVKQGLMPLLLIECKAENSPAQNQVFGYNDVIGAPFVCICLGENAQTFWKEKDTVVSAPFLPSYTELYQARQRLQ